MEAREDPVALISNGPAEETTSTGLAHSGAFIGPGFGFGTCGECFMLVHVDDRQFSRCAW